MNDEKLLSENRFTKEIAVFAIPVALMTFCLIRIEYLLGQILEVLKKAHP